MGPSQPLWHSTHRSMCAMRMVPGTWLALAPGIDSGPQDGGAFKCVFFSFRTRASPTYPKIANEGTQPDSCLEGSGLSTPHTQPRPKSECIRNPHRTQNPKTPVGSPLEGCPNQPSTPYRQMARTPIYLYIIMRRMVTDRGSELLVPAAL